MLKARQRYNFRNTRAEGPKDKAMNLLGALGGDTKKKKEKGTLDTNGTKHSPWIG